MDDETVGEVRDVHPIIVCEGRAEEVIVRKLMDADALVYPTANIVDVTRTRRAADIQDGFLNYDYDWPVCIARVLDSRKEKFRLGNLYRDRYQVKSYITHPEIEVLVILREGQWTGWQKVRRQLKPSDYCKQRLGLREIKTDGFLKEYWDVDSIKRAASEYKRRAVIPKGELCLADLIRYEGLR